MTEFIVGLGVGVIIVFVLTFLVGNVTQTYKDGQIDCLNHKIYYQLTEQEDGTTQWEYVPEGVEDN